MAYAVDANPESGDAVVGGFTFGLGGAPATFGSGPAAPVLHSRGSRAGFVSKVSAAGTVVWATPFGGTYSDEVNSVALDLRVNDVLLGGFVGNGAPVGDPVRFGHSAEWGAHTLGGADAFVARVNADGGVMWASLFGGSRVDMVLSVGADSEGNALVAGYFESTAATFGTGAGAIVLYNAASDGGGPSADAFALKLSAAGTLLWAVQLGGAGYDVVWGADVAPLTGELYVGGSFEGDGFAVGPEQLEVPEALRTNKRHGFVVKIAKDGSVAWTLPVAGAGNEDVLRIAVDAADGSVYMSAATDSYSALFGNEDEGLLSDELAQRLQPLPRGTIRAVVAQLAPGGQPMWAAVLGAGLGFALALDPVRGAAGALVLGGALRIKPSPFALPSGTASALLTGFGTGGDTDAFVARFAGPLPELPPGCATPDAANATANAAAVAAAAAAAASSGGGGSGGGGSSMAVGAGGAVGGAAVLAAAVFYVVRRRRRTSREPDTTEHLVPDANRRPSMLQGNWGAAEPMPAPSRRKSLHAIAARSLSPAARGQPRMAALQAVAANANLGRATSPAAAGQSRLAALQAIAARPLSPPSQRGVPASPAWGAASPSWGPSPTGGRPLSPGFDASRRPSERDWPAEARPSQVQLTAASQRALSPGMRPQLHPRPPSPGGRMSAASLRPASAEAGYRAQLRTLSPPARPQVAQDTWEVRPPAPVAQDTWELKPPAPPQLQFREPPPDAWQQQRAVRESAASAAAIPRAVAAAAAICAARLTGVLGTARRARLDAQRVRAAAAAAADAARATSAPSAAAAAGNHGASAAGRAICGWPPHRAPFRSRCSRTSWMRLARAVPPQLRKSRSCRPGLCCSSPRAAPRCWRSRRAAPRRATMTKQLCANRRVASLIRLGLTGPISRHAQRAPPPEPVFHPPPPPPPPSSFPPTPPNNPLPLDERRASQHRSPHRCTARQPRAMGLIASCLACLRPVEREAPPAALGAADDTVFDPALLRVDGEALRAEAHALGDAAHATSAASQQAYQSGDGAGAKQLSVQANAKRTAAAAKNQEAARAIFAQKNNGRGLWEVDLHLLLVAEALERVKRRLQACAAAAAAEGASSKELVVIYGQGHHSSNGVAKIKPAVLQLLAEGGFQTQEGVPNAGCVTVRVTAAPPRARL